MASKTEKRRAKNKKKRDKINAKIRTKMQKPFQDLTKMQEDSERRNVKNQMKFVSGKDKEGVKYKRAVLKEKTPKLTLTKPKTPTKRKIKTDLAKRNIGKAAKKVLKASANPYLLFLETALSSSPLNEGEEEAIRKRNEEYSRRTGILRASGGIVKNYANGGGVRKAKFTDN